MAALHLSVALLASLLLLLAATFLGLTGSAARPETSQGYPGVHLGALRGLRRPQLDPEQFQEQGQASLLLSSDQAQSSEALHREPPSETGPAPHGSRCSQGCTRRPFLGGVLQRLGAQVAAAARRSVLRVSLRAPYKGCTVTFKNAKKTFARCATLDKAGKFRLAWTMNKKTGVAATWFEGPPDKAYGWVSWGISPSGKMLNSDSLVAYGNPWQTAKAKVRPYFLAGVKAEQCQVDTSVGFLSPVTKTLAVEVVNKGKLIRISASVKALDIPGVKAVIWRGGPGVTKPNFESGKLLLAHKDNKKAVTFIDFNK